MTHTWADVAYSFVNGDGVSKAITPIEFIGILIVPAIVIYVFAKRM